jgi:hypothetical protein
MNRLTALVKSLFRGAGPIERPMQRPALGLEALDDRCLPSISPAALASPHNPLDGAGVISSTLAPAPDALNVIGRKHAPDAAPAVAAASNAGSAAETGLANETDQITLTFQKIAG